MPVSSADREKTLDVVLRGYVERMASSEVSFITLGPTTTRVTAQLSRTATVRHSQPLVLGGREALLATVDVVDVNQLKVDPDTERTRVQLVFVKTGYEAEIVRYEERGLPVIMVVALVTPASQTKDALPDFASLLSSLELGPQQSTMNGWDEGFPGARLTLPPGTVDRLVGKLAVKKVPTPAPQTTP